MFQRDISEIGMDGETETPPAPEKFQVRIAKSTYRKSILRQFSKIFGLTFMALFVVYLCFAATIIRVIPSTNNTGFVGVKNLTAPGGIAQPGSILVVNTKNQVGSSIFSHLGQGIIPTGNVAKVIVLSGPYGKLDWKNNKISVNGKVIDTTFVSKPKIDYLNNQYIVECITGDCSPGESSIISAQNIYGQPITKPHIEQYNTKNPMETMG